MAERLLRIGALVGLLAQAEAATALVECTADTALPLKAAKVDSHAPELPLAQLLLTFRFEAIRDWAVSKATLHFHLASGSPPATLEFALLHEAWTERDPPRIDARKLRYLRRATKGEAEGWMTIELDGSLIEMLAGGKGTGVALRDRTTAGAARSIHSRESVHFAPYLIVEGQSR
jgi:hypothetical protein